MSESEFSLLPASQRLQKKLIELQVIAKKSLGQNFLISDQVIHHIIKAVQNEKPQKLVEIGPGCGALTDLLLNMSVDLTLIELDRDLAEYWRQQKQKVIEVDALQMEWTFDSDYILVSNLPYQISSSIVIERSLDLKPLKAMVLMFQKEVAQRIKAQAQTEHYGMLSVIAQEFWSIEIVCDAGPRDFKPAPKVSSRVLKFKSKISSVENKKQYLSFVKACFRQRRRVLTTNLNALNTDFDRQRLNNWFIENKKSEKVRAEELSPAEINSLYHALRV